MVPYTRFDTNLRAKAVQKSFEEDHFNLMNNAVFGKTLEDVEKRISITLVRPFEGSRMRRLFANLAFISRKLFSKDLANIHSAKTKITLNRPIYFGMCVLNISNFRMYHFWHNHLKK